jgi:hypothetical protein
VSSLILHPDVTRLQRRIAELRQHLAERLDEHIRLSFEELPKLRDRYADLFGELERTIQERTLERSQRKRMVELFALKLDRGQKLDARMVELVMKAVGNEFATLRSRVDHALGAEDRRRTGRRRPAREEESQEGTPRQQAEELRGLYRRLAKRLHPDVRRTADELTRTYWDLVQKGYHRGDLQLLRTLENVVDSVGDHGPHPGSTALAAEEERLEGAIRREETRIDALKEGEPYVIREKMKADAWIAERRAGMEGELAEIEEEIDRCNRFLDPILESAKAASPPEIANDIWSTWVESMYFNGR